MDKIRLGRTVDRLKPLTRIDFSSNSLIYYNYFCKKFFFKLPSVLTWTFPNHSVSFYNETFVIWGGPS